MKTSLARVALLLVLATNWLPLLRGQALTIFGGSEASNTSVIYSLKNDSNTKGAYKSGPRFGVRYRQRVWKVVGMQAEVRYAIRHRPDLFLVSPGKNSFSLIALQIPVHPQSRPEGIYSVAHFGGPYISGKWLFFSVAPDVQLTILKNVVITVAPKYSYGRLLNSGETVVTIASFGPRTIELFETLYGRDPKTNEVLGYIDPMNHASHEFGGIVSGSYKLNSHFSVGAEYERYFGRSNLFQNDQYFSWLDEARWVGYSIGVNTTYKF